MSASKQKEAKALPCITSKSHKKLFSLGLYRVGKNSHVASAGESGLTSLVCRRPSNLRSTEVALVFRFFC